MGDSFYCFYESPQEQFDESRTRTRTKNWRSNGGRRGVGGVEGYWGNQSLCYDDDEDDSDEDEESVESLLICSSRGESSRVAADEGERWKVIRRSTITMVQLENSNRFELTIESVLRGECHQLSHLPSTSSPYITVHHRTSPYFWSGVVGSMCLIVTSVW